MNDLFKMLTEESSIAIFVADKSTYEVIYMNRLAFSLMGCENKESCAEVQLESFVPRHQHPEYRSFDLNLLQHNSVHNELILQKFDGGRILVSLVVKELTMGDRTFKIMMVEDITFQAKLQREIATKQNEITRAYEDLLIQNTQLKELDVAKDRFIALTTHELRTPLSAMVASADVLVHKLYDDEAMLHEYIQIIHEQGNHMLELVNDILDFAKIQSGKMDYYVEQLPISPLLHQIANELQPIAHARGISISVSEGLNSLEAAHLQAYYDKVRMSQVLNNIVGNAIKYNVDNGTIELSLEIRDQNLIIHVKDSGPGIPADKQDAVFNEFETVGAVNNHQKGTGLGLPIARRMMREMGGTVTLFSEPPNGSTFSIFIPQHQVLEPGLYRSRKDQLDDLAA